MSVLAAYLDDSGTHVGSGWVVVAGGVSSVQQWVKLSREWERTIGPWKLKKGYFRMADFVNGVGEYSRWSPGLRAARLNRLITVISKNVRILVGNAVKEADFKIAFSKCPTAKIGTAYRFCAFLILPAVNAWREKSPTREPVAFFFESGNKLMNEYGRILGQIDSHEGLREKFGVGPITEAPKSGMQALQAADLIAYATYKCLVAERITPPYLEHAFARLFENKHTGTIYDNVEKIEKYLRTLDGL
jgi:hypothetical protein